MPQLTEHVPESLDAFDRALQIDPNDAYAWEGKARALTSLGAGREREVLEACDRALAINPNLPNAHY
jgi:tetratricopeptide (TPR) repeat protein